MKHLAVLDFSNAHSVFWHAMRDEAIESPRKKVVAYTLSRLAEYDHLAVAVDSPPYRRKEKLPDYKAQREEKPRSFYEERRRCIEDLRAIGVHIFAAEGYEADDVISALVCDDALADAVGEHDWTILSSDKDLFQLIGPDVQQVSLQTGKVYTVDALYEKWGITPAQVPAFLALTGDASDNIPGVAKVGPKTAARLLNKHGSIANLLHDVVHHGTQFTPALATNLREAAANLPLWEELTTLDRNVPIDPLSILEPAIPAAPTSEPEMPPEEPHMSHDDYDDDRISSEQRETRPEPTPATPEPPAAKESRPKAKEEPDAALATVEHSQRLQPRGLRDTWWIANKIVNARLFSEKFGSADEIAIVIVAGSERGWGVWASLQNIQLIKGRPAYSAQSMVALAQANPHVEYIYPVEVTARSCTFACKRREWPKEIRRTYTYEMAADAGLTRPTRKGEPSMWDKRSEEMCFKQAGVLAARTVAADSCSGMYSPEEMSDGRVVDVDFEVERVAS